MDSLRDKLTEAEASERQQSLENAHAIPRLQADNNVKSAAVKAFRQRQEDLEREVNDLVQQLRDSQQAVARHQAEAKAAQGLLTRLTPKATVETPKRGSRRKAASL